MKNFKFFCSTLLLPFFAQASLALPENEAEILENYSQLVDNFSTILQEISTPKDTTLKSWNQFANTSLVSLSKLSYLAQSNSSYQNCAQNTLEESISFLYSALQRNEHLHCALFTYLQTAVARAGSLSSYERYQVDQMLESFTSLAVTNEEKKRIEDLKAQNALFEKTPYLFLRGKADELKSSNEKNLTILSLNTCMLPGDLSLLYGGLLPWQERVAPLAEKILETDADVVCLQEVHPEEASFALYEQLAHTYAYFYVVIGPRPLGVQFEMLGLPSSLFVASKYPIENPRFSLFSEVAFQMNYGFFDFIVKKEKQPLAHIYTTHLQSLNWPEFAKIRSLQLDQILSTMREDVLKSEKDLPILLCGDLNIPFGSSEPGEHQIQKYFFDAYNEGRKDITLTDRTHTDYFTTYYFSKTKDPQSLVIDYQIIDYFLLLTSLPDLPELTHDYQIQTQLIPFSRIEHPESALSDHQGLLTTLYPRCFLSSSSQRR